VAFLRTLFCLTPAGKRSKTSGCARFRRLAVSGFAHHPYARGGSRAPATPPQTPGEITISSPGRLYRVLDAAARAHRIPRRLPIYYTEFGFQTNPPDPLFGVRPARQAAYINQADWMAYRDPRVRAVAQYKLVDDAPLPSFQSGLRFSDGRRKPAYAAYRLPIWVSRSGSRTRVYGQVRPGANGTPQRVQIEVRPPRSSVWLRAGTVTVLSRRGQFVASLRRHPGAFRLRSGSLVSRTARMGPR
jgi:hypothetical protein